MADASGESGVAVLVWDGNSGSGTAAPGFRLTA